MKSTFTAKTKEFSAVIKQMETVGKKFAKATMLKISVLPDKIEISIHGIMRILNAKTEGFADILVPGIIIKSYLMTSSNVDITFTFGSGYLQCGSATFTSPAITIETVFNVPAYTLPINPTRIAVLRFAVSKTSDEIERLGLTASVKYAKRLQKERVQEAYELLKEYEVTFEELNKLIESKIHS